MLLMTRRMGTTETLPSTAAYFRAMALMGTFGGALTGGAIAAHLPTLFAYQMMTLFLLSGVLRLMSVVSLLPEVYTAMDIGY